MTLQLNICSNLEIDRLLLKHNNRPMKALYKALRDTTTQGIELPMAVIMDQRCGIERRAEETDVSWDLVGASPLIMAINEQRTDVAKALLAAGADPNAKASTGRNSLMVAIRERNLEAIETLIRYGADINAVDNYSRTPLHSVAVSGLASLIEPLEPAGANLEAADNKSCTPLHYAASDCRFGIIKALIKLGANQAAVDNVGRTPLHWAAATQRVCVETIEAFQFNVAAFKANLTAVDKNGHTPLQVYESLPRSSSDYDDVRALLTP